MQHDTNPSAYQGNPDSLKRCRRAAALQAAAPDLLRLLNEVLMMIEDSDPPSPSGDWTTETRRLIKKISGE